MTKGEVYEENTYTSFSFKELLFWKYSRIRTFFHRRKSFNRKEVKKRLKVTRELSNTRMGPALIMLRGPSSDSIQPELIDLFLKSNSIFVVNRLASEVLRVKSPKGYIVVNDEPFWRSSKPEFHQFRISIEKEIHAGSTLIQPAEYPKLAHHDSVFFFDGNPLPTISKHLKPSRTMGIPNITAFFTIAFARHLGFSPIILSGFDLSFCRYLTADEDGYWLSPHHSKNEAIEEKIPLASFRRSVSDLFGSMAFQIEMLKLFSPHIFLLGHESLIDSVPKMTQEECLDFLRKTQCNE